jgi:hypothetical protein
MKLKNVNPNGENVVASNLINMDFFFPWKIVKIELKNEDHMLFFLKDAMIAQETKFLILFISQINIEWIKASLVDMDIFYKKKEN